MKKVILYLMSVIIGICAGVLFHCSFMLVEAEGLLMLPTIEPGQNVVVSLLDKDVQKGDIVAFEPPYYTLDGEGNIVFRRVEQVDSDEVLLTCDTQTTKDHDVRISKEKLLGKVILGYK